MSKEDYTEYFTERYEKLADSQTGQIDDEGSNEEDVLQEKIDPKSINREFYLVFYAEGSSHQIISLISELHDTHPLWRVLELVTRKYPTIPKTQLKSHILDYIESLIRVELFQDEINSSNMLKDFQKKIEEYLLNLLGFPSFYLGMSKYSIATKIIDKLKTKDLTKIELLKLQKLVDREFGKNVKDLQLYHNLFKYTPRDLQRFREDEFRESYLMELEKESWLKKQEERKEESQRWKNTLYKATEEKFLEMYIMGEIFGKMEELKRLFEKQISKKKRKKSKKKIKAKKKKKKKKEELIETIAEGGT